MVKEKSLRFYKEFKDFAVKGNMVDLAIGVIIGGSFSKIVSSLVSDVIMPPIGLILGKVDFSNLYLNLSLKKFNSLSEAKAAGVPTVNYGIFLNNLVDFVIVSLIIFGVIKMLNKLRTAPAQAKKTTTDKNCPYCYSSINIKATRCPQCTSKL